MSLFGNEKEIGTNKMKDEDSSMSSQSMEVMSDEGSSTKTDCRPITAAEASAMMPHIGEYNKHLDSVMNVIFGKIRQAVSQELTHIYYTMNPRNDRIVNLLRARLISLGYTLSEEEQGANRDGYFYFVKINW